MLLALKADELEIVDDRGKEVEPAGHGRVDRASSSAPRTRSPRSTSTWPPPTATAKTLATLKVKAEVTVPAGAEDLPLPQPRRKNVTQKQGDISVTLESTEVDEQVWKVNVELDYPGEGPAFESYRQGLFNNRLWLQKADGSRFEHNGGFSNTALRRRQARLRVPLRRRPRQAGRLPASSTRPPAR